jgi:hypothetical protein
MEDYEDMNNLPGKLTPKRTPQTKVFSFNDPGFNFDEIQRLQQDKGGGSGAGGGFTLPYSSKEHFRREVPAPSIMMTMEPSHTNGLRLLLIHQKSFNSVSSASFASAAMDSENKSRKSSFSRITKTSPNKI